MCRDQARLSYLKYVRLVRQNLSTIPEISSLYSSSGQSLTLFRASAYSRDLFGNREMRFIGTAKVGTDPLRQLASGQQAVMLDHVAVGMHPFGFNGIKPGTLGGQQEWQNPHAFACLLDLLIVLANPGANRLTLMPGGIIPDQEPVRLALLLQAFTTPVQELSGDSADGS